MTVELTWGEVLGWPDVLARERSVTLSPDVDQRAAIAEALDLPELMSLQAKLRLTPWLDGVQIDGVLSASATRLCGISLEPFAEQIDETMCIRIVPLGSANAPALDGGEVVIDLDTDDPPDVATDGSIDLCAYVVEALALGLDPFPRKPGAEFTPPTPEGSLSPFAVLSNLVRRPD